MLLELLLTNGETKAQSGAHIYTAKSGPMDILGLKDLMSFHCVSELLDGPD